MKADDLSQQRFALDVKGAQDLRNKLKQDPKAGLHQAAQQFEGMLLQMMLKGMRDATPQDGMLDSDQSRFYTSILDQQLAQNLSATGRVGFARMIEQQLGKSMEPAVAGETAASPEALQQALLSRQLAAQAEPTAGAARIRKAPPEAAALPAASPSSGASSAARDFVNRLWPHALDASQSTGVPPHFLVAHAALETGWGKSEIRNADGTPTYNLFGVKAGRNWQGATVEARTTEYVNGAPQAAREKFRAYGSYAEAFRDYASLLRDNPRFSGVVGQQDGTEFARSLQQSGYATDPMYADKLGRIINGSTLRQALVG